MALETFNNQIDITELSFDRPEQAERPAGAPFDARYDVPEARKSKWEFYANMLATETYQRTWDMSLFRFPGTIKMLDPERFANLNLSDRGWQNIFKMNDHLHATPGKLADRAELAAYAKLAYPHLYNDQPLLDRQDLDDLYLAMTITTEYSKFYKWANAVLHYSILASKDGPGLKFDDGFFESIQDVLDGPKKSAKWVAAAFSLRFLFPKKFKGLNLSAADWIEAKQILNSDRATTDNNYAEDVRELQFVAAEDIIFTDQGVHLVMPQASQLNSNPQTQIPQERKF